MSDKHPPNIVLQNGLIIDGSGSQGVKGNLYIKSGKIQEISQQKIDATQGLGTRILDCTSKIIAPGFIDMHSHNDWFLPAVDKPEFTSPFTSQGITTFIGGNCGFGVAGFKDHQHKSLIENNLFKAGHGGIRWSSMEEYFQFLSDNTMSHNLINLAGHGTSRASIRGFDSSPMNPEESAELLRLLEEALDQGARGISLGLGYEPGVFTPTEEFLDIARLLKKKDRILTVHLRAFSTLSGAFPMVPFVGTPHNILAIKEMLEIARKTGVRLQISHLIFVGTKTWKNYETVLALIDNARKEGLDVQFDTYAHHCGASLLTGFLPPWFLAGLPHSLTNRSQLRRLKLEIKMGFKIVGFDYRDIQVTHTNNPELEKFNGMFLPDIAKERGLSLFENFIDLIKKSNTAARVLMYKYSNEEIMIDLIKHPASLFMTDSWIEPGGFQNPAAFGSLPRILQLSRQRGLLSPEEAVRKMTGASAERFGITDRGILKEGLPADITVFDWNTICDNTTPENTSAVCSGVDAVFINGMQVAERGRIDEEVKAGVVVR
ncbi:MAG: amidohydrolase family protein [bacterium]|nr:amidohydrolase family protein [bacterium]